MELDELNHAGEAGVFGSLRVLGDVNSKNIQLIKRDVSVLQNVSTKMNYKLDKYWTSLSDDGIITAPEKLSLKKEWDAIVQTHAALLAQATAKALTSTSYWQDYQDAYEDLYELLYVTEKLFDNMEVDTNISDVDNFNTIFNDYYYAEQFVQLAIVSGLIDKLGLRGLENLEEEGTEGELAFYRGELYQYHSDAWVRIGTETYLGVITTHVQQLDEASEGQYFLAGGVFQYESVLYANDEVLIANNEPIMLVFSTVVGNLYYFDGTGWELAADDDPRYVAILADYINLMGKVPSLLDEKIDDSIRDPAKGPQYRGVSNTLPALPKNGDWFVYSGITTTDFSYGRIYRYNINKLNPWELLNPNDLGNSRYYMSALQDILALEEAGDGYFSTLFCNAFFANKASINALKVQTIFLYDTGQIQSQDETYSAERVGLKIDASGNIDANGNTHLGASSNNKVAIGVPLANNPDFNTYDVVIGGNTKIGGDQVEIIGTVKGMIRAEGLIITGFKGGDIKLLTVESFVSGGAGGKGIKAYKSVGTGVFRCKMTYFDRSTQAEGQYADFWLKVNDVTQWTDTIPNKSGDHYAEVDISVSFGDIITVECEGGGRVSAVQINCDLCMDKQNEIMSLLSTPYWV